MAEICFRNILSDVVRKFIICQFIIKSLYTLFELLGSELNVSYMNNNKSKFHGFKI